jgi:hypothetical protein
LERVADFEVVADLKERQHAQNGKWPMMSLPIKTLLSDGIGQDSSRVRIWLGLFF